MNRTSRRYPVGAEVIGNEVSFRVWAPDRNRISLVLDGGREIALAAEQNGYFSGRTNAEVGSRYRFRLDGEAELYPDPASRYQPDGPHGPSEIVDPAGYRWGDVDWGGVQMAGQVIYELHVGTFTLDGTWVAAIDKLAHLKDVGITLIEMMPVNDFPGHFGWGYDGVNFFAPTRLYGTPDNLRAFIDAAHAHGIGVILDVVYNHLGPAGNVLPSFAQDYFSDQHANEWGKGLNFDGPNCNGVRDFVAANAAYWIEEFHFDGLRLDATQNLIDSSDRHVIDLLARSARQAAGGRSIVIIGENERQDVKLVQPPKEGGFGLDALWNDDFHHSAMVAATGRNEAYYEDHLGTPQEFISAAKYGYLFQGQRYAHQGKARGTAGLGLEPQTLVNFLQNHDQVANSARGLRFHQLTSPGRARALTVLTLLLPATPMLFQGQEFWSSTPFLYFADHDADLADEIHRGRREFLTQFPSLKDPMAGERLAVPADPSTFEACRLDWSELGRKEDIVALHRDLLRLRRTDPVFSIQAPGRLDGAVLADEAFVLRFFGEDGVDRLLFVNLGRDLRRPSFAEPLVAPPAGMRWELILSSEDPAYGGAGTPPVETDEGWILPGHAAVVMAAARAARV